MTENEQKRAVRAGRVLLGAMRMVWIAKYGAKDNVECPIPAWDALGSADQRIFARVAWQIIESNRKLKDFDL